MHHDQIEHSTDIVSNAYHGTSVESAHSILENGYTPSKQEEFLGDGVYFYLGSIDDAAHHAKRRRNIRQYAVLRAEVLKGHCLDLSAGPHRKLMEQLYNKIVERKQLLEEHNIDNIPLGLAINILATKFLTVDTVLGVVVNKETVVYPHGPYAGSPMSVR